MLRWQGNGSATWLLSIISVHGQHMLTCTTNQNQEPSSVPTSERFHHSNSFGSFTFFLFLSCLCLLPQGWSALHEHALSRSRHKSLKSFAKARSSIQHPMRPLCCRCQSPNNSWVVLRARRNLISGNYIDGATTSWRMNNISTMFKTRLFQAFLLFQHWFCAIYPCNFNYRLRFLWRAMSSCLTTSWRTNISHIMKYQYIYKFQKLVLSGNPLLFPHCLFAIYSCNFSCIDMHACPTEKLWTTLKNTEHHKTWKLMKYACQCLPNKYGTGVENKDLIRACVGVAACQVTSSRI